MKRSAGRRGAFAYQTKASCQASFNRQLPVRVDGLCMRLDNLVSLLPIALSIFRVSAM